MRTLYVNVVNLCKRKKKQTEVDDVLKYQKEKSTLCFTYLFKIQISNFLYIKLHMGTSI